VLQELITTLSLYRLPVRVEAEMHQAIDTILRLHNLHAERECQLGSAADRIDFVVRKRGDGRIPHHPAIGIECKVQGSAVEVAQQLLRYANTKQLDGLILVTSKAAHVDLVGDKAELAGVPFAVLNTNRGAF